MAKCKAKFKDVPEALRRYVNVDKRGHPGLPRHPLDKVKLGCVISKEKYFAIQHYAYNEGLGMREIVRLTGISSNAVSKYFPRDAMCACGKPIISHRQCSARWQRISAEARQGRIEALKRGKETQARTRAAKRK